MKPSIPLLVTTFGALGYAALGGQGARTPEPEVNFDRDVSPIISQHCYKCHGPDAATAAAGLRLDSFAGATKSLGNGFGIVPGNPAKSMMIELTSTPNLSIKMPPSDSGMKPLTPDQIDTLRLWIKQGAHYTKHWSYVSPTMPTLPKVSDPAWCKGPIDRFVLAKLDAAKLKPEAEADRNTLALRAAETLTGLPPTAKQLDAYRRDTKPGAYERYVDKLLATPEYGEQQARYWLDAVRYADTHGLQLDNERSVFAYRDWVVRAFNDDLPFNKFVLWQLAGDLLPHPTTDQLVATGYVRMNLTSNEGGAIAEEFLARNTFDRVDTTSTVMLGLTVGCAKCHDHKYDPIKQKDYYGLYAYFDSTQDAPLDGNIALPPPFVRATTPAQDAELSTLNANRKRIENLVDIPAASKWLSQAYHPAPASSNWQISPIYTSDNFDVAFDKPFPGEPGQPGEAAWKPFKYAPGTDANNIIGKDNSSVYIRATVNSPEAKAVALRVSSDDGIRMWLNGKLIHSHKIGRGLDQGIDTVNAEFKAGDNELVAKLINGSGPDGIDIHLTDAKSEQIESSLVAYQHKPSDPTADLNLRQTFLQDGPITSAAKAYADDAKQIAAIQMAVPQTLIAQEMMSPRPTFILKRGEYDQKGDAVTRHLPAILGKFPPGAPNNRLGLAEWMIEPTNPLVPRVFVNRIWQQFFGTAIVKTVEDLGSQGEWPLNQPLLDYLAVSFVKNGWSIKKLNRMIVTSAAFRQSSRITPEKLAKDSENRLISRGPRFRLDAEEIRDKALADGGLLVEKLGGRGFKPYQPDGLWESSSDPESGTHVYKRDHDNSIYRRSMYMFWKRTSPPPVMITFDAPLRDTCTVRRSITNTPLQALVVMNEPAFLEASRTMAARVLRAAATDAKRLNQAYEIAMGRAPKPKESALLLKAVARYRKLYAQNPAAAKRLLKVGDAPQDMKLSAPDEAAWMIVCSSLMNTNEYLTLH